MGARRLGAVRDDSFAGWMNGWVDDDGVDGWWCWRGLEQ